MVKVSTCVEASGKVCMPSTNPTPNRAMKSAEKSNSHKTLDSTFYAHGDAGATNDSRGSRCRWHTRHRITCGRMHELLAKYHIRNSCSYRKRNPPTVLRDRNHASIIWWEMFNEVTRKELLN